jgi:hypothetical protein
MIAEVQRYLQWRRRLREVRDWQEYERRQAAEHSEAIRRILGQHPGRTA